MSRSRLFSDSDSDDDIDDNYSLTSLTRFSPAYSSTRQPPQLSLRCFSTATMFLPAVTPFLLLPFAAAAGVQKLKLKKFDTAPIDPSLESAYLAEKYGAQVPAQLPLLGSGGQGRRLSSRPVGDDLYWTQEEILGGGYKHPLSSALPPSSSIRPLTWVCVLAQTL
jgi:hypothetical protein